MQKYLEGTTVKMIDLNGWVATGFIERYNRDLDSYDCIVFDRKAEVTVTTDVSASGRFGNFGGNPIKTPSPLRYEGARHLGDTGPGPRFIFPSEDELALDDYVRNQGQGGTTSLGTDPPTVDQGQGGGTPAPIPVGVTTAPLHPDIAPGVVQEPEGPAPEPPHQKHKHRQDQ